MAQTRARRLSAPAAPRSSSSSRFALLLLLSFVGCSERGQVLEQAEQALAAGRHVEAMCLAKRVGANEESQAFAQVYMEWTLAKLEQELDRSDHDAIWRTMRDFRSSMGRCCADSTLAAGAATAMDRVHAFEATVGHRFMEQAAQLCTTSAPFAAFDIIRTSHDLALPLDDSQLQAALQCVIQQLEGQLDAAGAAPPDLVGIHRSLQRLHGEEPPTWLTPADQEGLDSIACRALERLDCLYLNAQAPSLAAASQRIASELASAGYAVVEQPEGCACSQLVLDLDISHGAITPYDDHGRDLVVVRTSVQATLRGELSSPRPEIAGNFSAQGAAWPPLELTGWTTTGLAPDSWSPTQASLDERALEQAATLFGRAAVTGLEQHGIRRSLRQPTSATTAPPGSTD